MEEDDSQDELINRSTSHSKGKRALWAISDDSDDSVEESEEGESDSGDQEDGNGEDEEEEDEEEEGVEEDDEEEEEDAKPDDGAFGGTSADFALLSSDEDTEKCPICLNSFNSQPVATPENCEHYFCFDCIIEWAKNANSCPVDRMSFNSIYIRKCYGGKVKKVITVQKPVKEGQEETVDLDLEQTNCEVCGGSDREDRLLLCDGCDAGYHMECLTPPLDSVPVEEWFCPECEANNRHSRGSAEEISDTDSLPSTARPATSHSQARAAGPTRAIARTQQSERVRANVNRHRITQARTSQLAPTYMMQSTWLDETINAVVAGLNTAVYIRDITPRMPSSNRRRPGKRRRVRSKKTTSAKGRTTSTGVKRRRRRARRTKSKKKLMLKKAHTPRSRIANSLGIVKDKKSSSLPTVYRPSEHTLSSMRVDIGAASLSIYGDPFDLDPFVDREEEEQQARVTSLLEAKRRGISRSALRSHQPVARPVTASRSRRGMDVPQPGGVVEAAPVPDLLGSILSGQSMLLMDSSDVVINRDGSLKATKQTMPSTLMPGCSSGSPGIPSPLSPVEPPSLGDSSLSLHNGDLPGSSTTSPLSQSSSRLPPFMASSASHTQPHPHSDIPRRGHRSLHPPHPNRPTPPLGHRGTNGVGAPRETASSSIHPIPDSSSKNKGVAPLSQPKKAPTKPMWVDVSVLPRIPKIKRENSCVSNDDTSQGGSNRLSSSRGGSSNTSTSSNSYGMPETGMNNLSGDKGRQQSLDQQKGQADRQTQRHRPDGASSSSAFSNSFSSSGSPASQPRYSSSTSSSSAVSFRINSSGNSWHSRRLSNASSSSSSGGNTQERGEKKDDAKKRQLHRDKQMLLASRTHAGKEQDSNNIYDPFNPTLSESSSSDDDGEGTSRDSSSQHATHEGRTPSLGKKESSMQGKQDLVQVKTETQENEISQEELRRAGNVKVEKESRSGDLNIKKEKALLDTKIKKEPGLHDDVESGKQCDRFKSYLNSETTDSTSPAHLSLDLLKTEKGTRGEESGQCARTPNRSRPNSSRDSSASTSGTAKKTLKEEAKSDSASSSKSPSRDLSHKKKTSKASKEQQSSSSETDKSKRGDPHSSGHDDRQKERDKGKERRSRKSRSRERRRVHSTSDSSQSSSPDRTNRKRRRSLSQSKDEPRRRRSRSGSSSSSRERERRKKQKPQNKERNEDRGRDHERRRVSKDKRRGRSRSKSQSKSRSRSRTRSRSRDRKRGPSHSRSRSRSRERRKDHTRPQQSSLPSRDKVDSQPKDKRRHRSRSRSRERRKDEGSSKSSQKNSGSCVSSSKDTKLLQDKKKEKDVSHKSTQVAKVKKEDLRAGSHTTTIETTKEVKAGKQTGKEKLPSLDMFEDFPVTKPIKEEETDTPPLAVNKNSSQAIEVKTETCEIAIFKSEPGSPQAFPSVTSFSTLPAPATADSPEDTVSPSHSTSPSSAKQENAVESTVPVKQEVQPPSDSDDDFSVDVMLDSLDCVKSENAEGSDSAVKLKKEEAEEKNEGEQVSTLMAAKSKPQVKRVTWNIQEPEGPQPEKSSSKLALYKLKLKQEGARRPSLAVQTSGQDTTGAVGDPSKKGAVDHLSASSRSDGLHPGELSAAGQGEDEEGDLSRKDKYLKKLHMQERAIEEVKLAIKPFYQKRDINKDEYKEILRKAVQKVCHSKSGEINPVKVGNLVKAYVDKYKHARKHKKGEDLGKAPEVQTEAMKTSDSP